MISLFIDTSYHNIIVGIYRDLDELCCLIEKNDNHLSTRLLPLIETAFLAVNIPIQKIDKIFVINGPGSFTGIRIGLVTAKTIGWALKKKVVILSELELLATTETKKKYVLPMIDARRGYVYAGLYDNMLKVIRKDKYIEKEKLLSSVYEKYKKEEVDILSYDDIENLKVEEPKINVVKIIQKHLNDEGQNAHQVNPNYLKKTEAEEKKDQKG